MILATKDFVVINLHLPNKVGHADLKNILDTFSAKLGEILGASPAKIIYMAGDLNTHFLQAEPIVGKFGEALGESSWTLRFTTS
eukprot:9605054-Karenia_brevis.AAC.1